MQPVICPRSLPPGILSVLLFLQLPTTEAEVKPQVFQGAFPNGSCQPLSLLLDFLLYVYSDLPNNNLLNILPYYFLSKKTITF